MPVISIIVPVYKVEPYLRKCIDSILAQTFTDFECILVDDGSPDNCSAICDEYAAKDSRIIVIHQKNSGVSAARNAGLDIAQGEWIGFVDSDDWCDSDMFKVLYENAVRYDVDVSICGIRVIVTGKKKTKRRKDRLLIFDGEHAILKMFTPNYFGGHSVNKLVKATLFSQYNIRYDMEIKYLEDILLFYNIFKAAKKVIWFSTPYYNYFNNCNSVTVQYGLTEAAKTGLVTLDRMISLENCGKVRKKIITGKILFSSDLCHRYIVHNDYENENFYILRKNITYNIRYLLFDFSISLKRKVICCLVLYPYLYSWFYHLWKYIKN